MQRKRTHISVGCINCNIFNQLITYLHESSETKPQVLKFVEGEGGSITYPIQQMNSDLVKEK